jgi:biopolymer transport protein ExbB/TolQ
MYERYQGERATTQVLCHPELAERPVPRVPVRAPGLFPVLAACLLLASVLVLFFQVRGFLDHVESRLVSESASGNLRLRAMGQQMEALRGKFHGLLAESVEMRLKSLEKIVESGKVSADDLRAFEELQKDLKALENYAGMPGAVGLDYPVQEHSRFRPMAPPQAAPSSQLMAEVVELKTLFYFCLAGLAAGTLALVIYYWVRRRRYARYIRDLAETLPLLPRQSPNGGS